ncbi:MAG: deoxyribodipyrimidine photo-lyase [Actinomycetota bacterium]|jgi:deoxyribodipyrimidine photo-lyase
MTAPSIVWFRRDLRLIDHPALAAALADGPVLPVYVIDPSFAGSSPRRRAVLTQMIGALRDATGGALVVRVGDPIDVVPGLAAEIGAQRVHVTREHTPYGRRRDAAVAERLRAEGCRLIGTGSHHLVEPGTVRKDDDTPYAVFTPFRRRWREHLGGAPTIDAPVDPGWVDGVAGSTPTPGGAWPWPDPVGEPPADGIAVDIDTAAALVRWRRFVATGLDRYADRRNDPADAGTSMMSSALRFGLVHPSRLLADLDPSDEQHQTFESELAWRDFYADVLHRRPDSAWENLDHRLDGIVVDSDAAARERFDRWRSGTTGFEIVDAGMRQLAATGWMHNRVRMIVASFLVKDLHLPWQWGARHFMDMLVDGDLASNNHGWQWAAGTGTDAAPYFRVFNPVAQAERWDPDGEYRARWLPELGTTAYPSPMVDHAAERAEALRRYEAARRA